MAHRLDSVGQAGERIKHRFPDLLSGQARRVKLWRGIPWRCGDVGRLKVVAAMQRQQQQPRQQGLIASLSDLALTSSLLAVCAPVLVMVVHLATGHPLDSARSSQLPGPLLALAMGTFVLVPMLALTGAASSLLVTGALIFSKTRTGQSWSRAVFLICVAAWGVVTAVIYDVVVIPVITS